MPVALSFGLGERVDCAFVPGACGVVVEDRPLFPDGSSWARGWLTVEWGDKRRKRVHALHLRRANVGSAGSELGLGQRAEAENGHGLVGEPRTGVVVALEDNLSRPVAGEAVRWVTLRLDGRGALHRCWHEFVIRSREQEQPSG